MFFYKTASWNWVFLYVLTFRLNSLVLSCHKAVLGSCTKNTWVGLKILLLTPLNSCKCPQVTLTTCTGLIRAAASIWQPCWIVIKQPHALHLLMWKVTNKHIILTSFATFGTNVNLGRICGLSVGCLHYILETGLAVCSCARVVCVLTGVGAVVFGPVHTSILAHLEIEALPTEQPGHYALQLWFCTTKKQT